MGAACAGPLAAWRTEVCGGMLTSAPLFRFGWAGMSVWQARWGGRGGRGSAGVRAAAIPWNFANGTGTEPPALFVCFYVCRCGGCCAALSRLCCCCVLHCAAALRMLSVAGCVVSLVLSCLALSCCSLPFLSCCMSLPPLCCNLLHNHNSSHGDMLWLIWVWGAG